MPRVAAFGFKGVDISIYSNYDDEYLPSSGTVYSFNDGDILVIAPDDWA